jgi:menaquinone-9 beta-reductase
MNMSVNMRQYSAMQQHPDPYDVVVVGAGPSGATAAYLLSKHGHCVCLVDKKDFPRPKLCAGLLTWKSMDLLKRVFGYSGADLINKKIVTHTCHNYQIHIGPKALVRRRLDFPFHFIERISYDNFWLQRARSAGCRIITGATAIEVDPVQGVIALSNGIRLKAGIIIGADGVWSKVRQSILPNTSHGQRWRKQLAMTIETRRVCPNPAGDGDHAGLHFGYLPWGYAWSFPGNGHQVLGIGGLQCKGSSSLPQSFRNFLNALQVDTCQLEQLRSHPLPYGNHLRHPAQGRVVLVGDACGLVDPLLGEGIYYAHRSGELAARAIITAKADTSRVASIYNKALNTHVLGELRWIKLYRNLLFAGGRGHQRRFRGLRLFMHVMPKRVEAAVQGQLSFSKLLWPWCKPHIAD